MRMTTNEKWDYVISGKKDSALALIVFLIPSVMLSLISVDQFSMRPGKSVILGILFAAVAILFIRNFVVLLIRFIFCKICIGKNGFYFRSGISDGKYYKYTDIKSCSVNTKTSSRRRSRGREFTEYWFIFRDKSGNTMKYQFNEAWYSHEIHELKHRINKASRRSEQGRI